MFGVLRGAYFYPCEDRYRRREFQSRDGGAHVVVVVMAWLVVFMTGSGGQIGDISRKSWLFLVLSGLATGASWLFYFRALQIGEASKVIPADKFSVVLGIVMAFIFLHEAVTTKALVGGALITLGTFVLIF